MSASELLARQLQLQRLIERSLDNFKKIGKNNLTPAKIRSRIASLKESWNTLLSGHVSLSKVAGDALRASSDFAGDIIETIEDTYQTTLDYISDCLEELDPPVSLDHSADVSFSRVSPSGFSLSHLPPIKLPPFDGKYDEWEQFRDRFQSLIIGNKDLTNFARMHFLSSCLKGCALDCIANLAITGDNFEAAWKSLVSRFESKRRLLNVHLASLLHVNALSRESATDLQALRDKFNLALSALRNIPRTPAELWNDVLVHVIVQKLDPVTRKAWNVRSSDNDDPPLYDDLDRFLLARSRALEDFSANTNSKQSTKSASGPKVTASTASRVSQASCPVCNDRHIFTLCPKFTSGSPSHRRELAKTYKRCFNCLSQRHLVKDCKSNYSYRTCQQKHHSLLHDSSESSSNSVSVSSTANSSSTLTPPSQPDTVESTVQSLCASTLSSPSQVLLATAWVTVSVPSGRSFQVRALLDQGSEMTFISEHLAQNLRTKRITMPVSVSAVGGIPAGSFNKAVTISVSPRAATSPSYSTIAVIMPKLTSYAPKRVVNLSSLSHLSRLPWADSNPGSSDTINVIMGADLYGHVILEGVRKGGSGDPIAQNSIFGWIISGQCRAPPVSSPVSSHSIAVHLTSVTPSLDDEIKRFWEIEEIPRNSSLAPADAKCEAHFISTHSRTPEGRYVVRLPFKTDPPLDIGESRSKAERQAESLSRRISSNPSLQKEYAAFLDEYERLGHMRRAPPSALASAQRVYIPHHPVFRESSTTSRLRVVFNASSVTSNGTSLNDHLLSGPKLQKDLSAIILRWRLFQYVYTSDIAKMYRQILVDSRDTCFQHILWKPSLSELAIDFQLATVTYGMACAPFLALRVIQQLASDEGHHFPLAVSILHDNIYVDDVLFGHHDASELRRIRDQLIDLLHRGGFELRKWASNSSELLADINPDNHGLACDKNLSPDEHLKILGIRWNPHLDIFQVAVSLPDRVPTTKRTILSTIARLYDPLGWVTPVTVAAKILMQHLWREQIGWDDPVPTSIASRWNSIYTRLSHLNSIKIPRWTSFGTDSVRTELHGFSDASNVAYAAVVYLRVVSRSDDVTVSLLAAKSRVAPLTSTTVPRLELCAAVLLSRLVDFVRDTLGQPPSSCICWSDSTVVLAWLKQHSSTWKTFVANRVAEIHSRLPDVEWRHVSTDENPADCASRGLFGDELCSHPLWWYGPSWLQQPIAAWPQPTPSIVLDPPPEAKAVCLHTNDDDHSFDIALQFSSWPKLLRVTAYIRRFLAHCRKQHVDQHSHNVGLALTASECGAARVFWLLRMQAVMFPVEKACLTTNRSISNKSSIVSLRPFLDPSGIIRVGGRLNHAPIPFAKRYPILLASHPLVNLIVDHSHKRSLHAGLQLTLATLRQDFWLLRARSFVRSIISKCVVCVRERAAVPSQVMGDLPAVRVSAPTRCFLHCGVDYAGPLSVRTSSGRGFSARKAYVALFVCLATRAIHLELVSDYSSAAFVNAFTRFCSRRGLPNSVYSDNGTTFVGADRELTSAFRRAIRHPEFQNSISGDDVSWHFIPPSAPHFGGLWEAGVKSVKHHLRRVLGKNTLTFEELTTLLYAIEACLNSRPIAPLTDALDDYNALTPGHFLIGSALTIHPEPSLLELAENRLSRWQRVRQITERFWRLWHSDYVNTLQQRQKWRQPQPSIKVGQLVLLRNPSLPPCKWELGRVTQCHPGSDGHVRVTIKTTTSELKRPIVKLCLLPVECET